MTLSIKLNPHGDQPKAEPGEIWELERKVKSLLGSHVEHNEKDEEVIQGIATELKADMERAINIWYTNYELSDWKLVIHSNTIAWKVWITY